MRLEGAYAQPVFATCMLSADTFCLLPTSCCWICKWELQFYHAALSLLACFLLQVGFSRTKPVK